jgi:hypothetical protein
MTAPILSHEASHEEARSEGFFTCVAISLETPVKHGPFVRLCSVITLLLPTPLNRETSGAARVVSKILVCSSDFICGIGKSKSSKKPATDVVEFSRCKYRLQFLSSVVNLSNCLISAGRKVKKRKSEGKDLCVFRHDVYNPVGCSCSRSGAKSFPRGVPPTCRSQTPPSVTIRSAPCRCRSRKCFSFHNESSRVLGYLASHRRPLSRSKRSSTESPTRAPAFLIPTSGEVGYIPALNTFLRGQALD